MIIVKYHKGMSCKWVSESYWHELMRTATSDTVEVRIKQILQCTNTTHGHYALVHTGACNGWLNVLASLPAIFRRQNLEVEGLVPGQL